MTEKVRQRKHEMRPERVKRGAIVAAIMTSQREVEKQTGIPQETLRDWLRHPKYADLRSKAREELAAESKALAHLALEEVVRRLPEFEPRDLSILFGILVDKSQLLSGEATGRLETRDLSGELDDHERTVLSDIIRQAVDATEEVVIDTKDSSVVAPV